MKEVFIGDVCTINPRIDKDDLLKQTCSFVPMDHVGDEFGTIEKQSVRATQEVKKGFTFFRERDVIIAKITPCMENGKIALAKNLINGIGFGSTEFHVLRANDKDIIAEWVYYFLRQNSVRDDAERHMTGSAGQQRVPTSYFQTELKISLTSLPEQKRIAAILDKADRLRRQRRFAQTLSDSFLQSVFIKMFGDGKSVPFVNVVQDPSEIIKKWHWAKLKTVAKLTTGHTPSRNVSDYWGGDIPWITTTDIRKLDGTVATKTSELTNALGIKNSSAVVHPVNTVCLCRTASVGFVTMMGKPMATSQDFVNWTCGDELNPFYLMFALIFSRPYIKSLSSGTTHKTIYFPTVEEFQTLIPPLPLQEEFAAIVQKFERIRRQQREATRQAEHLFQTLLHRAFRGEL